MIDSIRSPMLSGVPREQQWQYQAQRVAGPGLGSAPEVGGGRKEVFAGTRGDEDLNLVADQQTRLKQMRFQLGC